MKKPSRAGRASKSAKTKDKGKPNDGGQPQDGGNKRAATAKPDESAAFDMKAPLPKRVEAAAFASGGFQHADTMKREPYEAELEHLQIELQKAMSWVRETGERVAIVFEGRDAAGKGGAIKRLTEHLNPRSARVVALSKPTETEAGQWYFQRYVAHMPTRGEMTIFDRSWYNRAGVEPVFGFCKPEQTEQFLREAPEFEKMLTRDGVRIIKFFLTIGREMQMLRLSERWRDPLARWKISPIDTRAVEKWDAYSQAFDRMLATTDTAAAPWTVLRANDKRRTRLEVIRHILTVLPYAPHADKNIGKADPLVVMSAAEYVAKGGEA